MAFNRLLALEAQGPTLDPRTHMDMLSMVAHICKPNSGQAGQTPKVFWADSLAYLVSPRPMRDTILKEVSVFLE